MTTREEMQNMSLKALEAKVEKYKLILSDKSRPEKHLVAARANLNKWQDAVAERKAAMKKNKDRRAQKPLHTQDLSDLEESEDMSSGDEEYTQSDIDFVASEDDADAKSDVSDASEDDEDEAEERRSSKHKKKAKTIKIAKKSTKDHHKKKRRREESSDDDDGDSDTESDVADEDAAPPKKKHKAAKEHKDKKHKKKAQKPLELSEAEESEEDAAPKKTKKPKKPVVISDAEEEDAVETTKVAEKPKTPTKAPRKPHDISDADDDGFPLTTPAQAAAKAQTTTASTATTAVAAPAAAATSSNKRAKVTLEQLQFSEPVNAQQEAFAYPAQWKRLRSGQNSKKLGHGQVPFLAAVGYIDLGNKAACMSIKEFMDRKLPVSKDAPFQQVSGSVTSPQALPAPILHLMHYAMDRDMMSKDDGQKKKMRYLVCRSSQADAPCDISEIFHSNISDAVLITLARQPGRDWGLAYQPVGPSDDAKATNSLAPSGLVYTMPLDKPQFVAYSLQPFLKHHAQLETPAGAAARIRNSATAPIMTVVMHPAIVHADSTPSELLEANKAPWSFIIVYIKKLEETKSNGKKGAAATAKDKNKNKQKYEKKQKPKTKKEESKKDKKTPKTESSDKKQKKPQKTTTTATEPMDLDITEPPTKSAAVAEVTSFPGSDVEADDEPQGASAATASASSSSSSSSASSSISAPAAATDAAPVTMVAFTTSSDWEEAKSPMDIAPVTATTPSPLEVTTPTAAASAAPAVADASTAVQSEIVKVVTAGLSEANLADVMQRLQQGEYLNNVRFTVATEDISKIAVTAKAILRTAGLADNRLVRAYKTEKNRFLILSSQKPGTSMMAILPPFLAPHILTETEQPQFPVSKAEKDVVLKASVRLAFLRSFVQDDARACTVEKNRDVYAQVLKYVAS